MHCWSDDVRAARPAKPHAPVRADRESAEVAITAGELRPAESLPSVRQLAAGCGLGGSLANQVGTALGKVRPAVCGPSWRARDGGHCERDATCSQAAHVGTR